MDRDRGLADALVLFEVVTAVGKQREGQSVGFGLAVEVVTGGELPAVGLDLAEVIRERLALRLRESAVGTEGEPDVRPVAIDG